MSFFSLSDDSAERFVSDMNSQTVSISSVYVSLRAFTSVYAALSSDCVVFHLVNGIGHFS